MNQTRNQDVGLPGNGGRYASPQKGEARSLRDLAEQASDAADRFERATLHQIRDTAQRILPGATRLTVEVDEEYDSVTPLSVSSGDETKYMFDHYQDADVEALRELTFELSAHHGNWRDHTDYLGAADYSLKLDSIRAIDNPLASSAPAAEPEPEGPTCSLCGNDDPSDCDQHGLCCDECHDAARNLGGAGPEKKWTIGDSQRRNMLQQIGQMNVLAISGGRVPPLPDGVELPVGRGYRVRVRLTPVNDYTVERVFVRGGKEWSYGKREHILPRQVGNMAYYASCYNNDSGKEWTYMGR